MNGNIYNYSLASEQYNWNGGSAYAIPPAPPGNISTITGEPIFTQSYINAYNTAFNQKTLSYASNYQKALNEYQYFNPGDINSNFVPGTFGYKEGYSSISNSQSNIIINYLQDDASVYSGTPYLFVSAGFWRRIWIYVFRLDYSYLWSSLCCECILKILKTSRMDYIFVEGR